MGPWKTLNVDYGVTEEFNARTRRALIEDKALFRREMDVSDFERIYPCIVPLLKEGPYTILDVGCGYGRLSPYLSAFDCTSYIGIDPNEERLEYADKHFSNSIRRFELGKAEDARYDADFVWVAKVIQHLPISAKTSVLTAIRKCANKAVLMWEDAFVGADLRVCARLYSTKGFARHMIPAPLELVISILPRIEIIGPNLYLWRSK